MNIKICLIFIALQNLKMHYKEKSGRFSTQQKSSKIHRLHWTVQRPSKCCRVASLPAPLSLTAVLEGPLNVHRAPVKEALWENMEGDPSGGKSQVASVFFSFQHTGNQKFLVSTQIFRCDEDKNFGMLRLSTGFWGSEWMNEWMNEPFIDFFTLGPTVLATIWFEYVMRHF